MLILLARETRPDAVDEPESPPGMPFRAPEVDCADGDRGLDCMVVLLALAIALAGRTCLTAEVVALLM